MTSILVSPERKKTNVLLAWLAATGSGSLLLSIAIHLLLGLGATFLIVEHFQKKKVDFKASAAPAAARPEAEHKVQVAKKNSIESAPPEMKRIVTTGVSTISLPEPPALATATEMPGSVGGVEGLPGLGTGSGGLGGIGGGAGAGGGGMPLFGTSDGNGLEGFFYDFKLTKDKGPTGLNAQGYYAFLSNYISKGWNDSMLSGFYKSPTPLYGSMFAISTRPSEDAPAAFGMEKSELWLIRYHGKVQAPETGNYTLIGFGDNILVVRVNGVTVLDAGWSPVTNDAKLRAPLPFGFPSYLKYNSGDPHLKRGLTFPVTVGVPVEMDVLVGDAGGVCSFFLLLEKEGALYRSPTGPAGVSEYPYFQIGERSPPTFGGQDEYPPYSTLATPWQLAN